MKRSLFVALGVFALALPAFALNNRSAVASTGMDTNPCTPASPCRSFTAAIAQTNPGGEVIALDSAGYGSFTVPTAITISGAPGAHAAITVSSGDGITVNAAPSDIVTIRNLVLIGAGGTDGILDSQSAAVRVLNCTLRGFTGGNGIAILHGKLTVDHSIILDADTAVFLNGELASVTGLITNSLLENYNTGVTVDTAATAQITNCTISGGGIGVDAVSTIGSGIAARAYLESCTLSYNGVACRTDASGGNNTSIIYLAQNAISYSATGVQALGAGVFKTFSNNRFVEIVTVGPLSPVALQ